MKNSSGANKYNKNQSKSSIDREIIFSVIHDILFADKYSNLLLRDIDSEHRAFINEMVYGVIERKLTLDFIIERYSKIKLSKLHKNVIVLLYMGIYQLIYMKTKDYAAIFETVELAKEKTNKGAIGYINGILRAVQRNKSDINKLLEKADLSVKYSAPQDLIELLAESYVDDKVEKVLNTYNSKNKVHLYVRRNFEQIEEVLKVNNITYKNVRDFLIVDKYEHKYFDKFFNNGDFAFIDISTNLVVELLNNSCVEDIHTVLDTCAAPGGKTLMLYDLYPNAHFIASDFSETRLQLVNHNIKKWGLTGVTTRRFDARKVDRNLYDLVICDVPCSGSGVVKRRPELKYKIDKEHIAELNILQKAILDASSQSVKNNGYLIYSTCSILKKENEDMVEYIEKELGLKKILSKKQDVSSESEGFFAALFKKDV